VRNWWALSLVLVVTGLASPGQAADALKGCFHRKFDKTWLKKVEKQFVTTIQIDVRKAEAEGSVMGKLSVKFRDDKEVWWHSEFECLNSGESWACSTHCDGGTFLLSRGKKGLQIINQRFLKFNREQCDAEPRFVYADIEHTSFTMPQINNKPCKM
jgi:hypothetical protein